MSSRPLNQHALEIDNLAVGHKGRAVLLCESLKLKRGEVVALLGASGSGKTTLFATLAGSLGPLAGRLLQDVQPVNQNWLRENVARTLQNHPLLHWLTVEQNIRLSAKLRKVKDVDPLALLERVSAEHLVHRWPSTLSGGERCRVSLAIGLVSQPQLFLLDEPFNGLDAVVKREAAAAVKSFVQQQQCAAILTTHDIEDALECSQKVAVIHAGKPSRVHEVWTVPNTTHERADLAENILAALT